MHPVEVLLVPLGLAFRGRRGDEAASFSHAPELATDTRLTLTSPSFAEGEEIPAKHCGRFIGAEISPALSFGDLPAETVDLLLVIEDLDVPLATPSIHTIVAFEPRGDGLPEGALNAPDARFRFIPGTGGRTAYIGPRPLPGHGPHHYRFHLYALDARVDATAISGISQVPAALDGHVLASGLLTGTRTS
ncbi:YbhB/YbcL family Raf kinase inhibitor-like protein [Subtercola lobariae]|uniref:Phosphatidylethanolamine-binding protein n=1 Tax=Subtercola lobariae TaxID=1588641 RepID=A0A917B6N1_9MICO|nr:YbhB/YbcL family Raf kinase inhibitor-like protein [Subtercola lobariae]GGF27796.1 phosphatidylethanolamine-binding protein [Subtercola lobariae]